MTPTRFALLALAAASLATLVPVAEACIQVYPWSELCEGDVEGFVRAWLP